MISITKSNYEIVVGNFLIVISILASSYEGINFIPLIWRTNPLDAFLLEDVFWSFMVVILMSICIQIHEKIVKLDQVNNGLTILFTFAFLSFLIGNQFHLHLYSISWPVFSFFIGMAIRNSSHIQNHFFNKGDLKSLFQISAYGETFIKVGIVLLALDINYLLEYDVGVPSIVCAVCIPGLMILITRGIGFLFRLDQTLAMLLAFGVSVCGASAAAAAGSILNASAVELSLVIGCIQLFAIVFMLVEPNVFKSFGVDNELSGIVIGGTVDSTGHVVASASILGSKEAQDAAIFVKVIQNSMIGVYTLILSLYLVFRSESTSRMNVLEDIEQLSTNSSLESDEKMEPKRPKSIGRHLWDTFPRFVVGYIVASILVSVSSLFLSKMERNIQSNIRHDLSNWWFCIGFVCVGLESDISVFKSQGDKYVLAKLVLVYFIAQTIDVIFTFGVAYALY